MSDLIAVVVIIVCALGLASLPGFYDDLRIKIGQSRLETANRLLQKCIDRQNKTIVDLKTENRHMSRYINELEFSNKQIIKEQIVSQVHWCGNCNNFVADKQEGATGE